MNVFWCRCEAKRKGELSGSGVGFVLVAVIGFAALLYASTGRPLHGGFSPSFLLGLGVAGICGLIFIISLLRALGIFLSRLANPVGPRPIPVKGKEEVDEEKAYGDSRPAGLAAIHAALGGGKPSLQVNPTPRAPRFED